MTAVKEAQTSSERCICTALHANTSETQKVLVVAKKRGSTLGMDVGGQSEANYVDLMALHHVV